MKTFCFPIIWVLSTIVAAAGEAIPQKFLDGTPVEWARRLAASEMSRRGMTLCKDGSPTARWDYTSGLFAHALLSLGEPTATDYATNLVNSFVQADGSIATYRQEDSNIDMITPGRVLLRLYEKTGEERLRKAIGHLREQLANQPRTSDGGFWHKQRYPFQMWLDGLYMGSPFLASYGKIFHEPAAFDEVAKQILLMDRHSYDPATGLFHHGWDEKRVQSWANPETGRSPSFWGRSNGWYAMAIVDCLDDLPPTHRDEDAVREVLRRLADGVVRHQDPKSGLWWQVMDQGGREGNYLESSASSMFVYALAKGINRGYLPRGKFLPAVLKGYQGLVREFIRTDGDGRVNLTGVCEVAGLGSTSASGKPRDGSYAYYLSEPVIENDLKGVGPFILAGLEMQQLVTTEAPPFAARSWADTAAILARIQAPEFPAKDFVITDFGAKPGTDCSAAIRAAIAACHASGGGRVLIPEGEWHSGAIHLLGNVNLHVSTGATVKFSTKPADYPMVFTRWEGIECMNYSALIYAVDQENIALTGGGTLDGQADLTTWWAWNDKSNKPVRQQVARDRLVAMGESGVPVAERKFGDGGFLRPNFIQFYRCKNVLIEGVTLLRSPMWEIHPVLSENITIRGVTVSSHGPNNDGCDPESSRDVLIEDCVFDTGDDCIAIKSGRNNDGRRVNVPSENIVIRRCVMKDGHGGVVLGSEISGSVRNVFIEDCQMDSPNLDRALRFKSNAVRGGALENVFMRNVKVGRVAEAVLTIDLVYEEGADGPHRPIVRNVNLEGISSENSPRVMHIRGFKGAIIDSIRIRNSTFRGLTHSDVVEHAGTIDFNHVTLEPKPSAK